MQNPSGLLVFPSSTLWLYYIYLLSHQYVLASHPPTPQNIQLCLHEDKIPNPYFFIQFTTLVDTDAIRLNDCNNKNSWHKQVWEGKPLTLHKDITHCGGKKYRVGLEQGWQTIA